MAKVRVEKLQELMKQEISDIIFHELKDPRIGFVTVTSVACTEDLREAKIYVSVMGDEKKARDTLNGLNSSLGFVRREAHSTALYARDQLCARYFSELQRSYPAAAE